MNCVQFKVGSHQSSVGSWQLAVGSWQLAVILKNNDRFSNSFSLFNCKLPTDDCQLFYQLYLF